ncbi:MAG: hypothetical protein IKA02_06550 [Clostridia bacterium]|nr:hypothetical protein [Clostridia bacterium]
MEIKDGEVSVKDGFNATKVAISNEYSSFELVLTGFTNESMDKALVMCAYSYDGTKITYLTNTENTVPKTVTYNQIAFS